MRKFLAVLTAASVILSLTGCGNDETSSKPEPEKVNVRPTLYSVFDAFDTVIAEAGYYDDANKDVVDAYLSDYDYTVNELKVDLERDPSTNAIIAKILADVGILASEVDWATIDEAYELPIFSIDTQSLSSSTVHITEDRDEFVEMIRQFGYGPYLKLIRDVATGGDMQVNIPDTEFVDDLLNELSITDVLTMYPSTAKVIDDNTIEVKLSANKPAFYELARRNEYKYVSYFPTIMGENGAPLYMRDYYMKTNIPLWQVYFCAYADYLNNYNEVKTTNAIYNVTNDGIEAWWSPSTGKTIELDVYESGLIRIVYGTDDRYTEYQEDSMAPTTGGDATVYTTIRDKLSSEYSFSTANFESFVTLARVFDLPCTRLNFDAPSDELTKNQLSQWLDAAVIFSNYLSSSKMTQITPYEYSEHLIDFINIGRNDPNIDAAIDVVEADRDNTSTLATAYQDNPTLIDLYKGLTDKLLTLCNSKSTFLVEGYNSLYNDIEYIDENALSNDSLITLLNTIHTESPLTYSVAREVFCEALNEQELKSLYDDAMPTINDKAHVQGLLSTIGSSSITEEMSVINALNLLLTWIGDGRSSVTKGNIKSIDTSVLGESASLSLAEVKKDKELKKTMANILQQALDYADVGATVSGTGETIVNVLLA